MLKAIFTISFIGCLFFLPAQSSEVNQTKIEEKAALLLSDLNDDEKKEINRELKSLLQSSLQNSDTYSTSFNRLKSISVLTPSDSSFRLFSWSIAFSDGTYNYECLIIRKANGTQNSLDFLEKRKSAMPTNFLGNMNEEREKPMNATVGKNEWEAAHYYDLIETNGRFNTYYTLLGWNGNDLLTDKKVIEVLWFNKAGDIKLGAPIFKSASETKSRIIFEFGGQNTMRLFVRNGRIMFDHLSPPPANGHETTQLKGIYDYYGPDLSFDALEWINNKWVYQSDVDVDKGLKKKKNDFEVDEEVIKPKKKIYALPSPK